MNMGKVNIASMFHFLETDIRAKNEMRTKIFVDNTVNDLRYEINF